VNQDFVLKFDREFDRLAAAGLSYHPALHHLHPVVHPYSHEAKDHFTLNRVFDLYQYQVKILIAHARAPGNGGIALPSPPYCGVAPPTSPIDQIWLRLSWDPMVRRLFGYDGVPQLCNWRFVKKCFKKYFLVASLELVATGKFNFADAIELNVSRDNLRRLYFGQPLVVRNRQLWPLGSPFPRSAWSISINRHFAAACQEAVVIQG
jgi:hypothetical protein